MCILSQTGIDTYTMYALMHSRSRNNIWLLDQQLLHGSEPIRAKMAHKLIHTFTSVSGFLVMRQEVDCTRTGAAASPCTYPPRETRCRGPKGSWILVRGTPMTR